jgi:GTPase SAR1 family protein
LRVNRLQDRKIECSTIMNAGTGPDHKVVLIGDSGTGKTSLLNRAIQTDGPLSSIRPTVGTNISILRISDVTLKIWDTA